MPRYIDADALMKEFRDFVRDANNSDFVPVPTWNDAVSLVGSAPTADVVEVVRCKDCKYRKGSACDYSAVWVRKNGFCKWGERKETEDE